ncbi:MAG: hypothetical protein LBN04_11510 [Oscillospiraceae bacterium]|jgi:hypothetical protein|nr:hypothetical protein [Oscillospiraceae bacterium]
MFSAHKKSNIIIVEIIAFYIISALFLRDLTIALLAAIPSSYLTLVLSAIILLSIILVVINNMYNLSLLPPVIYYLSFYFLIVFCVVFKPTYLPQWVKIIAVLACITSSVQVLQGIWTQKRWHYVYQFELIDKVKMQLIILSMVLLVDIIDSASFNPIYFWFVIAVIILGLLGFGFDRKKVTIKFFCFLYVVAVISMCIYHHLIWENFFRFLSNMLTLPVAYYLHKNLCKRKAVFLLTVIVAYNELFIYIQLFNFLPDNINMAISIIGLGLNIIAGLAVFIQIRRKSDRELLSKFVGIYTPELMIEQVVSYIDNKEKSDDLFGSSIIKAVEYAGQNVFDDKLTYRIREKVLLSDNIFTSVTVKELPKILGWLRHQFWFIKLHWRAFVSILIIVVYLPATYPGIHNFLTRFLSDKGKVSAVFQTVYYAQNYSIQKLNEISNGDDISNGESFSHYIARIYENKADEYMVDEEIGLQIQALSLSLYFEYDYDTLYKRFRAFDYTDNYYEAAKDISSLLLFEESKSDREYLLLKRSSLSLLNGYYEAALIDAQILGTEYSSVKNEAWIGACLIGYGDLNEGIGILNECLEKDENLPYWVYRMRGIAYLSLAEKGEDEYISNAISDIMFACNGEKSYNNILAYARLCLYSGNNELAIKLVGDVIDADESNGRAYYWLSKCYNRMNDKENELLALKKSRDLNYIGNGEY